MQCAVGHLVCSCCRAKLAGRDDCHMCGAATTGGFSRCFAVEHILESVRVPCANAGRGCPAKTTYHAKEEHEKTCPHADAEAGAQIRQRLEQGGNDRANRCTNLVAGLGFACITFAIPVVLKHFSLPPQTF